MAIDSDASNRCEEASRSSDALGASGNGSSPGSRGPAMGYPIVRGSCVVALPADDEGLFQFAMHLVLNDDYHGLMELARRGRADVLVTQRCGFTLHCLSSENKSASSQQALRLRGATILHYAVCVRSLRAASALLVIAPHLASQSCRVEPAQGAANGFPVKKVWTTQDLLLLLCSVYAGGGQVNASAEVEKEIMEAYIMFNLAHAVLNGIACAPMQLPFVNLPTVQERVAAAGCDADRVIAALADAGRLTLSEIGARE